MYGEQSATNRHVVTSILPYASATSLESPVVMANVADIDILMLRRNPAKSRRKEVLKEQLVAFLKYRKVQIGCVSQDSDPKMSILRKVGELRLNASAGLTVTFSGCTWYQIKIRERKGPSQGIIQKCEPHVRNPFAPKFEKRTHEETSRQEDCARKEAWTWLTMSLSWKVKTKLRFNLLWTYRRRY